MNNQKVPKYVTQARAAFLLGMPVDEIGRISHETGIGRVEKVGNEVDIYFTYEELQKICVHATSVPVHA